MTQWILPHRQPFLFTVYFVPQLPDFFTGCRNIEVQAIAIQQAIGFIFGPDRADLLNGQHG